MAPGATRLTPSPPCVSRTRTVADVAEDGRTLEMFEELWGGADVSAGVRSSIVQKECLCGLLTAELCLTSHYQGHSSCTCRGFSSVCGAPRMICLSSHHDLFSLTPHAARASIFIVVYVCWLTIFVGLKIYFL